MRIIQNAVHVNGIFRTKAQTMIMGFVGFTKTLIFWMEKKTLFMSSRHIAGRMNQCVEKEG
jgi:hypothetical protein